MNRILKLLTVFLLLGSAFFLIRHFNGNDLTPSRQADSQQTIKPKQQIEQKETSSISVNKYGVPSRLIIPKLQVDSYVESVGVDSQNRMDVPKNADNVAWYDLGYKPGEKGNAVMAGHLDTTTGSPAVFYNLSDLQVGDEIKVVDQNNKSLNFAVEKKEIYAYDQVPMQDVFGASSYSRLNLITCTGWFNQQAKNYSSRVVIYSRLVD